MLGNWGPRTFQVSQSSSFPSWKSIEVLQAANEDSVHTRKNYMLLNLTASIPFSDVFASFSQYTLSIKICPEYDSSGSPFQLSDDTEKLRKKTSYVVVTTKNKCKFTGTVTMPEKLLNNSRSSVVGGQWQRRFDITELISHVWKLLISCFQLVIIIYHT